MALNKLLKGSFLEDNLTELWKSLKIVFVISKLSRQLGVM